MLEVRVLERYPDVDWTRLVERCGGNPLHLPHVHLADRSEAGLRFIVFLEDGVEVACSPAFVEHSRPRLLSRSRSVTLPTTPAIGNRPPLTREEVYEALLQHCRAEGYRRVDIGHTWGDSFRDGGALSASITDSIVDFVLDLRPDMDAVRAGMHKAHRKNVRRAGKLGLTVNPETSLSGLLQLQHVQRVSADRAASRGHGFQVRDSGYFRRVHEHVYARGIGEVLLAREGDECVAALAYLWTGTKGLTVRSGCTTRGYATYAMYLLQDAVLERVRERGVQEINLGGVPAAAVEESHPQHGLYEFKRGFGGREFLRTAVSMDLG